MKKEPTQNSDLGLGDCVIQENRTRFLNRDGLSNELDSQEPFLRKVLEKTLLTQP